MNIFQTLHVIVEEQCVNLKEKSNNNDSAAIANLDTQSDTQSNSTIQTQNIIKESVNISNDIKDVTSDFVPTEKLKMLGIDNSCLFKNQFKKLVK
jgi:hypothetical protein